MPDTTKIDLVKLNKNARYIADPLTRDKLYRQFSPNFCFHQDEINFPDHPDEIVKNIITSKRTLYLERLKNNKITIEEQKELNTLNEYFFIGDSFNENYHTRQNELGMVTLTERINDEDPHPEFLILDEKHYGLAVGSIINVKGIEPASKKKPPCCAAITPTENGFCIDYEFIYPLNNAITGLRWLRTILPESWCKKLSNLGFHYGDCEGVSIFVNINDKDECVFDSMRTWAHGRDFSRNVPHDQCTYDERGHPCVYVGLGGHPSYADNFVGRNAAMDLVGDAYQITPDEFFDTSQDILSAALAQHDEKNPEVFAAFPENIQQKAKELPHSLSAFRRIADSNPATFSRGKNPQEVHAYNFDEVANRYKPFLFFTKLWHHLKAFIFNQPKHEKAPAYSLPVLKDDTNQRAIIESNCQNILSALLVTDAKQAKIIIDYVPKSAKDLTIQESLVLSSTYKTLGAQIGIAQNLPQREASFSDTSITPSSSTDINSTPVVVDSKTPETQSFIPK